jgi:hypothetical protein
LGQPFPNSEECKKLETSKFGQYSCTQLLREMEASLSNAEDESMGVAGMEDELVMLSEALLEKAREYQSGATLPENLYVLHESTEVQMQDQVHVSSLEKQDQGCNMNNKKWGVDSGREKDQQAPAGWQDCHGESSGEKKEGRPGWL